MALFLVLSASLDGPKNGNKSSQVYPEHPNTRGLGVEADDLHLSDFINGHTEGNILNSKVLLSAYEQVFSAQDKHERVYSKITSLVHSFATRRAPFRTPS